MKTSEKILKLYKDKSLWKPPSYSLIAKKVGCSKTYVSQVLLLDRLTKKQP